MKIQKLVGLALLGLVALAPKATEAGVITYSAMPIGPALTEIGTPMGPVPWAFQQFNPAMGVLQSVTIDIFASMVTDLTATNAVDAGSNANGDVSTRLRIYVQDPGLNLFAGAGGGATIQNSWGDFAYSLTPGSSVSSGPLNSSASSSQNYTSGAVLSEFTGLSDMFLFVYTNTATTNTNSGGNFTASQATMASLMGNVTYNFNDPLPPAPVPEPASMFLLGSGAVALVRMRRKQRAQ